MTGRPPPSTPAELRQWIAAIVPEKIAAGKWPLTGKQHDLSTKQKTPEAADPLR